MPRIILNAGNDLVQRLAGEKDPVRAIIELVWNSLDADANKVSVTFERNDADGIVGVTVRDDGLGMSPERVEQDFKWVGNSWKVGPRHRASEATSARQAWPGASARLRIGNTHHLGDRWPRCCGRVQED